MPVRLNGSTSGYVELASPAVGGSTVLELPTDSIKPGLVLVNETTFSAASTVSVNNCFTSTYVNYRVLVSFATTAADQAVYLKMRASSVDSSTGYYSSSNYITQGTAFANWSNATNATQLYTGTTRTNGTPTHIYDIQNPQLTQATALHMTVNDFYGTTMLGTIMWANHSVATAYDGFTLYPAASTFSGTVRIYGYRNSL